MDKPTTLDKHRGLLAQKATELRRLQIEVETDQAALKAREEELEKFFLAGPAEDWAEAVEKTRYLLGLFNSSPDAQYPRRQLLIQRVLADFDRLLHHGD